MYKCLLINEVSLVFCLHESSNEIVVFVRNLLVLQKTSKVDK
jgi:hypothetical protein